MSTEEKRINLRVEIRRIDGKHDKGAGWAFSIETGCFVSRKDMTSRKCILITRVQ